MLSAILRFLSPPIFEDEEKTRTAHFLTQFSWVAIIVVILMMIFRLVYWTDQDYVPLSILGLVIFNLLAMQVIIHRGYVRGASIFVIIALWVLMTVLAWFADGLRDLSVLAYVVVIILSSLLLGWRVALAVGILSIFSIWYFAIAEKLGLRPLHMDDPISYARDLTGVFLLIGVLVYLLISRWTRTLNSARVELNERLRAEQKLQRQAEYLTALHETALGLLNRSDLKQLLESILERACDLIGTNDGLIELVLPNGSAMRQELGRGVLSQFDGYLTRKGSGVTGLIWETGRPMVIDNYSTWENRIPEFAQMGIKEIMGVPLLVDEKVIGAIAVFYLGDEGHGFSLEQVDLMERFAALAALAIHNARLNEQVQNELRERNAAEAALRSSEERFRKVFYASPVAICITSLEEGRMIDANKAYWQLSKYAPAEAIGRQVTNLNMWISNERRSAFVERLKREHSIFEPEYVFLDSDHMECTTLAFFELIDIKGQTCILSMFLDVTEQKRAQNALREAEARTRAILTSIPDMIFQISKDGIFLDFMASSETRPILPPEAFLSKKVSDIFPDEITSQTHFAIERALATGQMHAFEYELPLENGMRIFEARISPLNDESVLAMVRDISQRKWVETEREKLIKDLEDKNAELERFTYTVSHDLKSPLITIKGFLGFLENDALSGNHARLRSDIKRIGDATEKMKNLLNELLELSRVGRLMNRYEHVSFNVIVDEAVELVQGRIIQGNIRVKIHKDMPIVYCDRQRMVEVIQNLVDNAAKFMGEQSQPLIEIGQQGTEDDRPVFFVRDNGIGIDPMHFGRIFGIFNKLDANTDGTGIGLALVKRIIEVHHGRIWVESEAGKGTTFLFTLQTGPES